MGEIIKILNSRWGWRGHFVGALSLLAAPSVALTFTEYLARVTNDISTINDISLSVCGGAFLAGYAGVLMINSKEMAKECEIKRSLIRKQKELMQESKEILERYENEVKTALDSD